jgi:hypothetical protein
MDNLALFNNVAHKDALSFGRGSDFKPALVAEWLDFDKATVSKITSVARSSVRYDEAAPRAVRERLEEIANIANMVANIFDGDIAKTELWFRVKNPMLGDISPRDMVRLGRYDRLRKFIVNAVIENMPSKVKAA